MEFVEDERVDEENRGAKFIRGGLNGSAAYGVLRRLFEKLIVFFFLIWFF